ncbi:MAG: precorrin-6A reductase [Actinobacteria bacterium]|nr:precorrin-6A reductase [Actinomycetota bacterium]
MANSRVPAEQKTIYLIGGTTEANQAARRLQEQGHRVVISVVTPAGGEHAGLAGCETEVGGKDAAAMESRARELQAAVIVDCSHPFAMEASAQAVIAAAAAGLPYIRYSRLPVAVPEDASAAPVITVTSFDEAAAHLARLGGRALLAIGTRHLEVFVKARLDFAVRVLPMRESLADCQSLGLEPKDIIAAWPPFSTGFNRECLRKYGATVMVTKDSGREGGLLEKLEAASLEGATVILVRRPVESGAIHDLDELVAVLDSGR